MRRVAAIFCLLLIGCSGASDSSKGVDTNFDAQMASQAISSAPVSLDALAVHAVCGPSVGKGLFGADNFVEWQDDGISEGRLIFVSARDNSGPNVLFRDATGAYTSALEDGGIVSRYPVDDGRSGSVWTIAYPSTGVTEVHNLVSRGNGLIDLHTSNKPRTILGEASAKIFKANCVRP